MKEYISKNETATQVIAKDLASQLKGGEVLAFSGNLGAGKTTFIKALAQSMGIKENITSPTFVLMKVYDFKYNKVEKFVHVDCYRLNGQEEINDIGLRDYLNYDNIIVAIEWADKIIDLPKNTIRIHIDLMENQTRKISIE